MQFVICLITVGYTIRNHPAARLESRRATLFLLDNNGPHTRRWLRGAPIVSYRFKPE